LRDRYIWPMPTNPTHDPALRSWVESANDPESDYPIQNLPLCAFEALHDGHSHGHLGMVIGDRVLDVTMLAEAGLLDDAGQEVLQCFRFPFWMGFARQPAALSRLRGRVQQFLSAGNTGGGQQARRLREKALHPLDGMRFAPPLPSFNYTDFYASIHHAATVGAMFRPENPLLPNYKWVPIGYHGRASSIVLSGSEVRRPEGQQSPPEGDAPPVFGPCKMLDYELEVGFYIGPGNRLGEPVPIGKAREQLLGLTLVNDWSARDIQKWEYQPLGPFLAKSFATTVSPFIVTMEAVEPFRCPAYRRPEGDPAPLPHLLDAQDQETGGLSLTLEVYLQSEQMRQKGLAPHRLSRSGAFRDMYWTPAQMVAHHSSNGCNLQPGDLLASGTVSGPGPDERGCLLELTWDGTGPDGKPRPRKPVQLPSGETRTFLQDGDEVIMRGFCEREGFRRIGLGECRGRVVGTA
jgi:fumarylacetoacetase